MAADPKVVEEILRAIRDTRASPRVALATKLTPIVESGVKVGSSVYKKDHDSVGAFQQRPSQGWGPESESAYQDAVQFIRAAQKTNKGFTGSAGDLAAAVQRPAAKYRGRYDEVRGQVASIFGKGGAGATSAPTAQAASAGSSELVDPGTAAALAEILGQSKAKPATPIAAAPPLPGFAARAVLPEGWAPAAGAAPAQSEQAPSIGDLAAQVTATADTSLPASPEAAPVAASPAVSGASGARGQVVVAPGANREGTSLTPGLNRVLSQIAGVTGRPIKVGTGTAHSTMTKDGRKSDHPSGNAADVPAVGKELTGTVAAALETHALGRTVQWIRNDGKTVNVRVTADNVLELAGQGGLFNIPYGKKRRIQVIGNSHIGGDHTNHAHIGVSGVG